MKSESKKVVVIDDDPVFSQILQLGLKKHGYEAYAINDAAPAVDFIEKSMEIDLYIVDFHLDNGAEDGLSLCRKIRTYTSKPIIMLTSETSVDITVSCLYAGADQYVIKPYILDELLARIHVTLNRRYKYIAPQNVGLQITLENVSVNGDSRMLSGPRKNVRLSQRELQVAEIFFARPYEDISRYEIYMLLFGKQLPPFSRAVDVIVARLRKKIAYVSGDVELQSPRSEGYRLTKSAEIHHDC